MIPSLLIALSLLPVAAPSAQTPSFDDFHTLASHLVAASPTSDLLSVQAAAKAAELSPEGNLPDPTVDGELLFPQNSDESNRWGVGVDWELEWPGVYSARREQARLEQQTVQAETSYALARRVQEVQSILVDLQAYTTTWQYLNSMLQDTDSLQASVERAHRGGEVSRIDVSKIRIERARLTARMEQVAVEMYDLQGTLTKEYGIRPDDVPTILLCHRLTLEPLEYYLDRYDELTQAQALRSATQAAEGAVKVARREALPGIGIGYRHAYEDANHFNGAALSLSIPLFSSKGKKKAAELRAFSAASEERVARQNYSEAIRNTYELAKRLDRDIEEIRVPIAEGFNGDLLRRAYEGGEWTLIQYLQERAFFTEAMLDWIELERAYNQAVTALSLI